MADRTQALTLRRLVARLEKTSSVKPEDPWWQATSTLSTVKYAQDLLQQLESSTGHAGPSRTPSRPQHDSLPDLRQRLDTLEARLQKEADVAKPPEPPKRAPLELRPVLPQPPAPELSPAVADEGLSPPVVNALLPVETDDLPGSPASPLRPRPRRASTTQRTDPNEISSLLSHHRDMQDELANDLAGMARQLKLNTVHFSSALEKDKAVVQGLENRVEGNLTGMKQEKGRLGAYSKKGGTTTCFVIMAVLGVTLAWSFMFILIRIS